MTEIKNEQNVQISTPDLSSVNLSTNTSEVQTQSEINTQTNNNISIEENKNNYNKKKKIATIGKRGIISWLILIFIWFFIFSGLLFTLWLFLVVIWFILRFIWLYNKNCEKNWQNLQNSNNTTVEENQYNNGWKNKISSVGRFLDILWLFFLMFSIFFIRVWWTGLLLLIWFSLLFVWFILWIIGSRRKSKDNLSGDFKNQNSNKHRINFPISVFIIIPIWFITMCLLDFIVEDLSLQNTLVARWWLWTFWIWIILWIIESCMKNKKTRIFVMIPIVLCILFILSVFLFEDIWVKYEHSLCYDNGNHVKNGKYVSYYHNWAIRREWNCKDWWEDGKRILYDYDWNIKEEQNYKNGELDWKRITYHDNWQIYDESNYKNGVRDWKQTYYFENWQVSYEWYIKNWKDIWKRVKYYENGNIEHEEEYDDFWIKLRRTFYYENGNIKEDRNYEPGDTMWYYLISYKNWKHTSYYENGNIKEEWKYSDWKKVWKRTYYNEDGYIKSTKEY